MLLQFALNVSVVGFEQFTSCYEHRSSKYAVALVTIVIRANPVKRMCTERENWVCFRQNAAVQSRPKGSRAPKAADPRKSLDEDGFGGKLNHSFTGTI